MCVFYWNGAGEGERGYNMSSHWQVEDIELLSVVVARFVLSFMVFEISFDITF